MPITNDRFLTLKPWQKRSGVNEGGKVEITALDKTDFKDLNETPVTSFDRRHEKCNTSTKIYRVFRRLFFKKRV